MTLIEPVLRCTHCGRTYVERLAHRAQHGPHRGAWAGPCGHCLDYAVYCDPATGAPLRAYAPDLVAVLPPPAAEAA